MRVLPLLLSCPLTEVPVRCSLPALLHLVRRAVDVIWLGNGRRMQELTFSIRAE